jgi:hypothetical protein
MKCAAMPSRPAHAVRRLRARMANLFANVGQLGRPAEIAGCLEMVTGDAARIRADLGLKLQQ